MLRQVLFSHGGDASGGFRCRGHEVSRLEAFSDAVFGFALTLLVVSLEVPASFQEMLDRLKGVAAFAVCFGLLVWLWHQHYVFFRRYGLADGVTVVLNTMLLFVVLLYVYPLKFLFTVFVATLTGLGPASAFTISANMSLGDLRLLFVIFGLGYAAVLGIFGLLYLHAYRLRSQLNLSALERHDTITGIFESAGLAGVGVLSSVLALTLPGGVVQFAGWLYVLLGPVGTAIGTWRGRGRRALAQAGG